MPRQATPTPPPPAASPLQASSPGRPAPHRRGSRRATVTRPPPIPRGRRSTRPRPHSSLILQPARDKWQQRGCQQADHAPAGCRPGGDVEPAARPRNLQHINPGEDRVARFSFPRLVAGLNAGPGAGSRVSADAAPGIFRAAASLCGSSGGRFGWVRCPPSTADVRSRHAAHSITDVGQPAVALQDGPQRAGANFGQVTFTYWVSRRPYRSVQMTPCTYPGPTHVGHVW